jgi:hypothetical protein
MNSLSGKVLTFSAGNVLVLIDWVASSSVEFLQAELDSAGPAGSFMIFLSGWAV